MFSQQNSSSSEGGDRPAILRPQVKTVPQITESHCGPAVLEILLNHLGISATQTQLAAAVGADDFIEELGMNIPQLAESIKKVFPQVQFWYKQNSTVEELDMIVHSFGSPVGVEWQGLFYNSPEEEEEDTEDDDDDEPADHGHYSIVKDLDIENDTIVIADPYHEFADKDRIFSLEWFESRWWDTNKVFQSGYQNNIRDERMMFVITKKGTYFPKMLEMTAA